MIYFSKSIRNGELRTIYLFDALFHVEVLHAPRRIKDIQFSLGAILSDFQWCTGSQLVWVSTHYWLWWTTDALLFLAIFVNTEEVQVILFSHADVVSVTFE